VARITSVFLFEDDAALVDIASEFIQATAGLELVGTGDGRQDSVDLCLDCGPEIVVSDLSLAPICGLDILSQVRSLLPFARTLVYTGTLDPEAVHAALALNINGFIEKSAGMRTFVTALESLARGHCVYSEGIRKLIPEGLPEPAPPLCPPD